MKVIAHISDLHFGREDSRVAEALIIDLIQHAPTLVAVSGDLTQRARIKEFQAARNFLDHLPCPHLVVPGNHDIPLYNVLERFKNPLDRYCKYISEDLSPSFVDNEVAVFGVNTAHSMTIKGGHISVDQIIDLRAKLRTIASSLFRIVVTHHQFIPPPGQKPKALIRQATLALKDLEAGGVDLLLAGHLHVGFSGDVRDHHPMTQRSILVAHAGTAISTRSRGEPNTYNIISVNARHVAIEVRAWNGKGFETLETTRYFKPEHLWVRE